VNIAFRLVSPEAHADLLGSADKEARLAIERLGRITGCARLTRAHPDRCRGLILRGIFLLRRKELLWFYQEGASWLFPEAWEEYLAPIPEEERGDMMAAYYKRLTSPDPAYAQKNVGATG